MPSDFLDQLATMETPQPPPEFDRKLHQRVNRALLAPHLLGLAAGCLPWALGHFLRGLLGAVIFSITGRLSGRQKKNDDSL